MLPDGRSIAPVGFTIPVESFASAEAISPDGRFIAVLSPDAGAVDIVGISGKPGLVDRLDAAGATSLAWTSDGLYVARGYAAVIARYRYDRVASKRSPALAKREDLHVETSGLLNGIAEDPTTHRIAVARTANHEVVTLDDTSGAITSRRTIAGEPYATAFAGDVVLATLFNSDRIAIWHGDAQNATYVVTGPHPTEVLADGSRAFVANADGHDVALVDLANATVTRRYELGVGANPPPGQTPSGMALSADRATLYVAESGYDDVAAIDLASGRLLTRIPTGWYPTAILERTTATGDKDPRPREQLYILSAKGFGSQPDPGGEWNGTYTGFLQHIVVEPNLFARWSASVARNDRFALSTQHAETAARALPPIEHVVFIVRENKHFDEEFADVPGADGDPSLLLYGRTYTPNAHALAARYTLFDNFMSNGEASDWGHAWTTQSMSNDYHERNRHTRDDDASASDLRVPISVWPFPEAGEDSIPAAALNTDWFHDLDELERGPRLNVSGVFGPRGELIDELARKGRTFRVYGEQMTIEPDGKIAPGLRAHADTAYPGAHIDFDTLDTDRAKLFLDDVATHGLAQYSYVTLPDDHTAGTKPGFYTPASFVANNDLALARIVAGLSKRRDWQKTVVFVTCDDAQGTGDHVDSHRMPALAIGPYVRRGFVDHTRYSIPSILRTVELLYGLDPLTIYDAAATPMLAAFARQPLDRPFTTLAEGIAMRRNPGIATSLVEPLDGPDSEEIVREEWASLRGARSLASLRGDER